jgi:hypothetical protein
MAKMTLNFTGGGKLEIDGNDAALAHYAAQIMSRRDSPAQEIRIVARKRYHIIFPSEVTAMTFDGVGADFNPKPE